MKYNSKFLIKAVLGLFIGCIIVFVCLYIPYFVYSGYTSLAGLYKSKGDYPKAESLYKQLVYIEGLFGNENSYYVESLDTLGDFYNLDQGNYIKARNTFEKSFSISEKIYNGKLKSFQKVQKYENPINKHSLDSLLTIYIYYTGEYNKAEELINRLPNKNDLGGFTPAFNPKLSYSDMLYKAQGKYDRVNIH